MRFRERWYRFWMQRNGGDTLYRVTVWLVLILSVVNLFFRNWIILACEVLLLAWAFFRCFSKNITARQRENRAFVNFFSRIGGWFKLQKNRFRDRKTHIYRKCPHCKRMLRLPKIKGEHTVCCPCCKERFEIKV